MNFGMYKVAQRCSILNRSQYTDRKDYRQKNISAETCPQLLQAHAFLFKIRVVDNRIFIKDIIYMKETKRVVKERYNETNQSLSLPYLRDSWKDLIGNIQTSNLKSLILGGNSITDSHINFLASFDFQNLNLLWLNDNNISKDGVTVLTQKKWPNLQSLSLCDNRLRKQGVIVLFNSSLKSLTNLNLGSNLTQHQQVLTKLDLDCTSFITNLNISNNKLGPDGVRLLTKIRFNALTKLFIGQCNIGDEGARTLTKGHWPTLEQLEAGYNNITMDGFNLLAQNNWDALTKLVLFYNAFSFIGMIKSIRYKTPKLIQTNICWWGLKNDELEKKTKKLIGLQKPNPEKNRNRYYDDDD